ncbi:MAG: hypothetical protein JXN61_17265 [Sedimentisphaerales bacterium]|nr:hypothetical protein [Sedimentisphaerales bacterium]
MVDSNYNIIKPVEGTHNVASLTPVTERKERNRPKNQKDKNQQHEQTQDKPFEAKPENKACRQQGNPNSIDYCA